LLALSIAGRDTAAYGELVRRHQSRVRGFLRRLCRNDALADDLAQDCFVRAWERLASFRGAGSLASWLMQIAYREFLQSRRKSQRYGEVLDEYGRAGVGTLVGPSDAGGGEDLEKMLGVLSDDERAVMILSYSYGMSHREIGQSIGMPVGTIKSHIHRAKQRIRVAFALEETEHA
jgi:RNA polymerase sigma-70 factor (ECF subfamily)